MSADTWDAGLEYGDNHEWDPDPTDPGPSEPAQAPQTNGVVPAPPSSDAQDDQFDKDVTWQVRTLAVRDAARTRYNAQRNADTEPEALDVAAVIRGEVDPVLPTMLTRDDGVSLLYPYLLHWLYGPPGVGKSWVALYAAAQLITKYGGHVAYFDWEGNRNLVGDRLRDLGVTADQAQKQFHYYRPGNLEPHTAWLATHAQAEWHLAIFDGAAKALAASGRKENENEDVLAWLVAVNTPLNDNGCATLMLDHVTKDRETRDTARGAGAKQGEVSGAAWELRAGQPFNRRSAGYMKLIQRKEREGRVGIDGDCVAELHVAPSRTGTKFELRAPQRTAHDLARAAMLEKVYRNVETLTAANSGQEPSTTQVWKIQGGNKSVVGELLAELEDLGHLRSVRGGNGRPTTWQPVSSYHAPAPEPTPGPLTYLDDWNVAGGQ